MVADYVCMPAGNVVIY